jgi:hypothetical protein
MTIDEVIKNKHWRDISTGMVVVVYLAVKIKTPVTNVFVDGIAYETAVGYTDNNVYVRSLVDFLRVHEVYEILYQ